ncbi:receptor-like cytosolic serine/threonine-protein kinase RBK2 [Cornus florida]|uniref:receptor-like cytosolic serine/threonine-protein kinase RBK2 n=1 Tax=Cornus florida TaxID=4283 RepID=UPI00289B5354|nr:receptor-like cytosolic serine/threonine-protein kinase RBK2 [Cornus florida]XP_059625799.1 receptor-like cytosolic serine/threonine-protein kinase RBK2 [Cornus florida]XP_059625800.1 receptor-like cytosolic serine/threonine-protein kinase RBK2 [Cornus florida]
MEKEKEKEKGDVYSPNGVLEDYLISLESERVSEKESTSEFEAHENSKPTSKWRSFVQLLRSRSKRGLPTLHPLKLSRRFSSMREDISLVVDTDLNYFKPRWKNFALSELQTATNGFCHENLIGKGGYAEVYKGLLRDGQLVAIKRLTRGPSEERTGDFLSELGIMAHLNHPNTAKLIGYGVDGGLHLVLRLSPHGSLASLLHGSKEKLEWSIRYKVALGTAEGLLYLHQGCQRRIIHRDIKAANILLTEDFEPQICDFGISKWLPEQWTHHSVSKFEGTFGYLAPEYLMHGIVDEKTDVFAFGVLLLELISGRRALDYSKQSLVMWAKPLLKKNNVRELVDLSLAENYNTIQMNLVVFTASLCIQQSSILRPQMIQVVQILKGEQGSFELVRRCRKPSSWKRYYEEIFNTEEYKTTRHSNGWNPQKQMAFEV